MNWFKYLRIPIVCFLCFVSLTYVSYTQQDTLTDSSDLVGELLFITDDGNGDGDIWAMNADGSNKRILLDSPSWDVNPTWSPDGSQIAFISNRSMLSFDIYTMNADGSSQELLADMRFEDNLPRWSPDGSQIVFFAKENGGISGIFIVDSGGVRTLIDTESYESAPDWSPDGSQIIFSSNQGGATDLYTIRPDGSDLRQLTFIGGAGWPHWSPDGTKIAFHKFTDGNADIYVMNADGSDIHPITNDPATDMKLVWSPDSKYIAFHSDRTGNGDIYVVDLTGNIVAQLTDFPVKEFVNDWRSDEIYVVEDIIADTEPSEVDPAQNTNNIPTDIGNTGTCSIPAISLDATNPWRDPALVTCINNVLTGSFTILDAQYPDRAPHCVDEWGNLTTAGYVSALQPDDWVSAWDSERYKRICCGWEDPYDTLLQSTCNCPCDTHVAPSDGQILYIQYDDDNGYGEILATSLDGMIVRNLSQTLQVSAESMLCSPNKREVVFTSNRDGTENIYIMDVGNKSVRQLTFAQDESVILLLWIYDTNKVAFERILGENYQQYSVNVTDGFLETGWTFDSPEGIISPDGRRIAIVKETSPDADQEKYDIFVRDESGEIQLTHNGYNFYPDWSPDSQRLVFVNFGLNGEDGEIYVINADGSGMIPLTDNDVDDAYPCWISVSLETTSSEVPNTSSQSTALDSSYLESILDQLSAPVDPNQIQEIGVGNDGLPSFMTYTFESIEIQPEIFVDTTAQYTVLDSGLQAALEWTIRNESDRSQSVEYIADLPKSFAESTDAILFSVPPTEIIDKDPLIKWLVDIDQTSHVIIRAQSAQLVASVQTGDVDSRVALKDTVANLLIDIDTRKQLKSCQNAIHGSNPSPNFASLCTLTVMSVYPGNFFPSDCDMAFDQIQGSDLASAFRQACKGILDQSIDYGQACDVLTYPYLESVCRQAMRMSLFGSCKVKPGSDTERCRYDAAVQSGDSDGCDYIQDVNLAATCNAYTIQDPNYCQFIVNPTALEACCGMFSYDNDLYTQCMGDNLAESASDEPIEDGETLTLGEVLGSDEPSENSSENNSGSGSGGSNQAEDIELRSGIYTFSVIGRNDTDIFTLTFLDDNKILLITTDSESNNTISLSYVGNNTYEGTAIGEVAGESVTTYFRVHFDSSVHGVLEWGIETPELVPYANLDLIE